MNKNELMRKISQLKISLVGTIDYVYDLTIFYCFLPDRNLDNKIDEALLELKEKMEKFTDLMEKVPEYHL